MENPSIGKQRLHCTKGKTIVEQSEPSNHAYYVEKGRAEVTFNFEDYNIKLGEIGPGEVFGEMGVIESVARTATVTALEDCTLAVITKTELWDRIEGVEDPVVQSMLTNLIKRLRAANFSQMQYYREKAEFQDRLAGVAKKAKDGIDPARREEFIKEIAPELDRIEEILDKYRG